MYTIEDIDSEHSVENFSTLSFKFRAQVRSRMYWNYFYFFETSPRILQTHTIPIIHKPYILYIIQIRILNSECNGVRFDLVSFTPSKPTIAL